MKRAAIIAVIAAVHAVLVIALSLATFEVSGFMFGVYPSPSEGGLHGFMSAALVVLMFPLGPVVNLLSPGLRFLAWPLVVANSLLWAVLVYVLAVRLDASRKPKPATPKQHSG